MLWFYFYKLSPLFPGGSLTLYNFLQVILALHLLIIQSTTWVLCSIRQLPKPLVSCGGQGSIVQGSSPHKCSQEVWWDALNVGAATIPSVMSGLTPSSKLFLHCMTSFGNVPLTWPYCQSVWPRHDNGLLGHGYDTWHRYLI